MPAMVPATNSHSLPVSSNSANQPTPSTEPNVPGATGIRPTQSLGQSRASQVLQVNRPVPPEVEAAGKSGQHHGHPLGELRANVATHGAPPTTGNPKTAVPTAPQSP